MERKLPGNYAELQRSSPVAAYVDGVAADYHAAWSIRQRIVDTAVQEIGVQEATGNNDGVQVEAYLRYVGL